MNSNQISGSLTEAEKTAILGEIQSIQGRLLAFAKSLTPEERRGLPKMGDKSRAFVKKCLEVANQNQGILPRAFDLAEFGRDVKLAEDMEAISLQLEQTAELVRDTLLTAGSDAYVGALTVYQSARMVGKAGQLDENLDSLGQRFARRAKLVPTAN